MTNAGFFKRLADGGNQLINLKKHPSLKDRLEIITTVFTDNEQQIGGAEIKICYRHSFSFVDYLRTLFAGEGFRPEINIARKVYWQYTPTLRQVLRVMKVEPEDYDRTKPLLQELDPNYKQTLTKPVQVLAPAKLFCPDHELTLVCSYWAIEGLVHVLEIFADQVRECGANPQCDLAATLTALGDKYTNEYRQKELELAEQEIIKWGDHYDLTLETIKSSYYE